MGSLVKMARFSLVAGWLLSMAVLIGPARAQTTPDLGVPRQNERAPTVTGPRLSHPKLDGALLATARAGRGGDQAALQIARDRGLGLQGNLVRVIVEARDVTPARRAIGQIDGIVERAVAGVLQVLVPPAALEALAAESSVKYVRPPLRPTLLAISGEGVGATGASAWIGAGLNGAGTKVAVLDGGFRGLPARQASGDLPANLVAQDFCTPGAFTDGPDHGVAVAEIVYEMAPGAQLYLVCADTELGLVDATAWVKTQNIPIVNHSVAWVGSGRGDGSGAATTPNGVVADARASGILWVNAAGNSAQRHWSGSFVDADNDLFHDFTPLDEGNTHSIRAGQRACFTLEWDDWPGSAQDFDLWLARSSNLEVVASTENVQSGTQAPVENLCYMNNGPTQNFALFIRKFNSNRAVRFDLWSLDIDLEYATAAGSVEVPASSPHALAVGAVCWQNPAFRAYSSQGPTVDGRTKPDLVAPDSVSSATVGPFTTCGSSGFVGTSASAPHVAGAAALVKQANPTFTAAQIQTVLQSRAIDAGTAGLDNLYGYGRLSLGTPPAGGTLIFGGRGFGIRAGAAGGGPTTAVLTWTDGNVETGYVVIRWSPTSGIAFLPRTLTPLGGSESSYTDAEPLVDNSYCYLLMAVGGTPADILNFVGFSDFLCIYPGSATGNGPANLKVVLNEGESALLTWSPPTGGSHTGYQLTAVTFDGQPPQTSVLTGNLTTITHPTQGKATCYTLEARAGATVLGAATQLCAVPHIATIGASPSSVRGIFDLIHRLGAEMPGRYASGAR